MTDDEKAAASFRKREKKATHRAMQKELDATRRAAAEQRLNGAAESSVIAEKKTGYEWFRNIGSPKFVVAPMVDQSDLGYRMLCREYGAQLVYTQMFNAGMFAEQEQYRVKEFVTCSGDRPLIVQFAGHDPALILKAAKFVEKDCDAVDINLGCPQGIAKRGRYGAFLMEELDLLSEIVSLLAANLSVPVTCKTRIYKGPDGWERTVKLAETLVNAGASMLTIHGRTREEKGHHVTAADWQTLRRLKEHFKGRVPIVCNGGIFDMGDVEECLRITQCDAVMSSEGVLENPGLFSRNIHLQTGHYANQVRLTEEYLDMAAKYPPWHMKTVRSHVQKMLYRYCVKHQALRDLINENVSTEELRVCTEYVRTVQQRDREKVKGDSHSNSVFAGTTTSQAASSEAVNDHVDEKYMETWYHRHWPAGSNPHAREFGAGCTPQAAAEKNKQILIQEEEILATRLEGEEDGLLGGLFSCEY